MTTPAYSNRLALTRVEAAQFLGLSPATIDRLTKRGLLRPSRATRRPLFPVQELQQFLMETTPLQFNPFPVSQTPAATATKGGEKNDR